MATTYVFDRRAEYGASMMLSDEIIDPMAELTAQQLEEVADLYRDKINALIDDYDPTLLWYPALSEVWGYVDSTESDPSDFRLWWDSGANGAFETALNEAWAEVMQGGENRSRQAERGKGTRVLVRTPVICEREQEMQT